VVGGASWGDLEQGLNLPTARNGKWSALQVHRVLERIDPLTKAVDNAKISLLRSKIRFLG
jgi:hypothetical protein